jgi:thiamine biosynthesis protein ThiS
MSYCIVYSLHSIWLIDIHLTETFHESIVMGSRRPALVQAKGKKIPWDENLTVRRVLQHIGYDIPGIFVSVNGRKVRKDDWDRAAVPDGAVLEVHRIAAGG